jgi:hypothetical protein
MPELAQRPPRDQDEFLFHQIQTGHTTRMTAEAAATLRWLKGRPSLLGIASNAQAYTVRELKEALATHGLGIDLFEPQLCFWFCEHGFSKPHPHVFLCRPPPALAISPAMPSSSATGTMTSNPPRFTAGRPAAPAAGGWGPSRLARRVARTATTSLTMTTCIRITGSPKRIGFISTRFHGTDGVTLEARKWAHILQGMGHSCSGWRACSRPGGNQPQHARALQYPEVADVKANSSVCLRSRALTIQIH